MATPVQGQQGVGEPALNLTPVLLAGVDGSNKVQYLKVTSTGALALDNSAVTFVTVQTGAPGGTFVTPLVYDNTSVTGGLYGWTGSAYSKIWTAMSQMQPDQIPPQLAALLQGQQDPDANNPQDELGALQDVITDLHQLLPVLKDPSDVQIATQCLLGLAKIQQRLMSQQQGGPNGPQPQG